MQLRNINNKCYILIYIRIDWYKLIYIFINCYKWSHEAAAAATASKLLGPLTALLGAAGPADEAFRRAACNRVATVFFRVMAPEDLSFKQFIAIYNIFINFT